MMGLRRQYGDVIRGRLARGEVRNLLDLGLRWVGAAASRPLGRSLLGPTLGTLLVTYRCNLRCRVCDLPQRALRRRAQGDRELDTWALKRVLRDMKAIGTLGVGFSGGEPMLRDDILELLAHARRLGLQVHLNTDGFRVAEQASDLLATGIESVNVSLDGATAATHDLARGRSGAFLDATDAIRALAERRRDATSLRITAVTVLTTSNIDQVVDVATTARAAGADRLGVIPVHDFGQGERAPDAERVARGLAMLRRLHEQGFLDNSLAYVSLIPRALRGEDSPLACYAPHTSVVVDCYGDVFPCFPLMERARPVGRLPLARLWRSEAYATERRRLAGCRDCLWNCHAEMNLALPQSWRVGRRTG